MRYLSLLLVCLLVMASCSTRKKSNSGENSKHSNVLSSGSGNIILGGVKGGHRNVKKSGSGEIIFR